MTGPDEQKIPAAPVKKNRLRSRATWMFTGSVLIVLVSGMVDIHVSRGLKQRIDQLERSQKTMTSQDDVATLRGTVLTQQKQLTALEERQAEYQRQLTLTGQDATTLQQLQAQLTAQQTELTALKDHLDALKKTAAPSPVAPVVPALPASNSIPQKHKSTPVKAAPAKAASRTALKVPFVLTGTERRGTATFAAVAPPGFSDLSQVTLTGVGESVAGWQLVSIGAGQATFRVNGRLQTVSVQ
ncbi:MAG: hypothetical protein QRY16_14230 [Enterobacterales bacterium endosymbiont of Blomia tropicalis]|uniref:hypothetical protein n=1 Tax=Mixta mediterraneensis TaxID=2758443 RepID=UPI0025A6A8D5|nr:hypothetical protein [Mixta mediterraneensis]MDL4914900.1 hypothetical protein [Mixta mediterraneensis]